MDLKGHARKVACVALSPDGARAATASEDGTFKVWRLDVRWQLSEDPKVILTVPLAKLGLQPGSMFRRLAFGPDGTVAASAAGGFVHFVDSATGELLERLHAHDADVASMAWSPARLELPGGGGATPGEDDGRGAVLATCSGARVRVWRSPKSLPVAAS